MRYRSQNVKNNCALFQKIFMYLILLFTFNCYHLSKTNNYSTSIKRYKDISYYKSGGIEYEAEYINNKLDGVTKYWSENGILISESEYSNGMPHGVWKKYNEKSTLIYVANYFHGKKHGKEFWYYQNGQVKSEQSYEFGKSINILRWHPDGSIIY